MSAIISESKRMELICAFLKTGKQPEGFKITETKNGKYRLSRVKTDKEALESKRKRLQKSIDEIDDELKKLNESHEPKEDSPDVSASQVEKPIEEVK